MKFCRYCGNKAPDDAIFCGKCGQSFTLTTLEPTSISKSPQPIPLNSEKADEEPDRRGQTPFLPLSEQYFILETGGFIPHFAVSNGVIYFSAPPLAFAINSNDGTMLWQYSWYGRGASDPVVVNNVVYYVTGTGIIYAFRGNDGALLWKYDLTLPASGSIMGTYPSPVIIKNTMYVVGWFTDNLYAINLDTHNLLWNTHVNNQQLGTLYTTNGLLYVNTSGYPSRISTLYALRADNGVQLWNKNNFFLQLTSNDKLYGIGVDTNGSLTSDLYALRSSDASTLWHVQMGSSRLGNMTIEYTNFYVITDTALYALQTTDGNKIWQTPLSYGYMVGS